MMKSWEPRSKKEGAALDDRIDRNGIGEPTTQHIHIVEPMRVFRIEVRPGSFRFPYEIMSRGFLQLDGANQTEIYGKALAKSGT